MNLFDFYHNVALRYQRECLGIEMSPSRQEVLDRKLTEIQNSYFGFDPPTYDDPDKIVAYTLFFAPKHAVIWRRLADGFTWNDGANGDNVWSLNSIGTGPGSEVFGMLSSTTIPATVKTSVVGLEREETWRDLLDVAVDEFTTMTKRNVTAMLTNDPKNLHKHGDVFGSLVLSEAVKQGKAVDLIEAIRDNTQAKHGVFLDYTYKVGPTEETKRWLKDPIVEAGFKCWDEPVKDSDSLAGALRAEMDACSEVICKGPINDRQPFNFYRVTFR